MAKAKNPISASGGRARADKLNAAERRAIATKAGRARWKKTNKENRYDSRRI